MIYTLYRVPSVQIITSPLIQRPLNHLNRVIQHMKSWRLSAYTPLTIVTIIVTTVGVKCGTTSHAVNVNRCRHSTTSVTVVIRHRTTVLMRAKIINMTMITTHLSQRIAFNQLVDRVHRAFPINHQLRRMSTTHIHSVSALQALNVAPVAAQRHG